MSVASRAPRPSFRAAPRPAGLRDLAHPPTPAADAGAVSAPLSSDGPAPVAPANGGGVGALSPASSRSSSPGSSASGVGLPAALIPALPVSVLLFRKPLPSSEGTDPYHDAFGNFCLPSFPSSALESGSTTPLPPPVNPNLLQGPGDRSGAERLRSALELSKGGQRRGRWITDEPTLTTHHLSPKDPHEIALARRVAEAVVPRQQSGEQPEAKAAADAALEIDAAVEWCVTSVPILETGLVHLQELAARLIEGAEVPLPVGVDRAQAEATARMRYRGVVITSQRAVEAYVKAAEMAADRLVEEAIARGAKTTLPPFTAWTRIPFFLVGPATEKQLRNVAVNIPTPFRPRTILGGPTTPNADSLAKYIIRHFADTPPQGKRLSYEVKITPASGQEEKAYFATPGIADSQDDDPLIEPLMVLTGDKNLPTLRDILGSVGLHPHISPQAQAAQAAAGRVHPTKEVWQLAPVPFEEVQVYETHKDPQIEEHLQSFVHSLPGYTSTPTSPAGSHTGLHLPDSPLQPAGPGVHSAKRSQSQPSLEPLTVVRPTDHESVASSAGSASPVLGRRPSLKATRLAERLSAIHAAQRQVGDSRTLARLQRSNGARSGSLPPGALRPTGLTPLVPEDKEADPAPSKADGAHAKSEGAQQVRPRRVSSRWDSDALEWEISERQWAAAGAKGRMNQPDWIAFFSPSGVQYALPHLRARGWLPPAPAEGAPVPSIADAPGAGAGYPKIAALGGTTKRWIRDNLKFWPDATATSPTPPELMNAISAAQKSVRTRALREAAAEAGLDLDHPRAPRE